MSCDSFEGRATVAASIPSCQELLGQATTKFVEEELGETMREFWHTHGAEKREVVLLDKSDGGFKIKGLTSVDIGRTFELEYEGARYSCQVRWTDSDGGGLQIRF